MLERPRVIEAVTIVFLLLLPPLFFWRETLGIFTLGLGDTLNQFFPAFVYAVRQLRQGELPLWNPNLYSGMPLFANSQIGLLDPLNWTYFISTSARAMTVSQELNFVVSLLATYAYARSLGWKRRSSVVTAVIYSFSGFAVARTIYPALPHVVALTPLVLFFIERLSQQNQNHLRWRLTISGAFIVAWQIFASHPQPFVYSSLLAGSYALFCAVFRTDKDWRWRFLAHSSLMFIGGVALAAVQLIPSWEMASQSVRSRFSFEASLVNSLHPISLLSALFPFFHGGSAGRWNHQLPYWGPYWHNNEAQGYLGMLALALAGAGIISAWRARRQVEMFFCVASMVALLLSFGYYLGPLAKVIYHLPLIGSFRSSNRYLMIVVLAVAVLAGSAVEHLASNNANAEVRKLTRICACWLFLFCGAVGGFILWRREVAEQIIRTFTGWSFLPEKFLQRAGPEFYLPIILAAFGLILIFIFTRTGYSRWAYGFLLAGLLLDFNLYASLAMINTDANFEHLLGTGLPAEIVTKQSEFDPIRYHLLLEPGPINFLPFWCYGHEMATGYDPLLNARYQDFTTLNEGGFSLRPAIINASDRTLDLLNVRYMLVLPELAEKLTSLGDTSRWREITINTPPGKLWRVFENLRAMPRAWLVHRVEELPDDEQLKLIRGEVPNKQGTTFDPLTTALVSSGFTTQLTLTAANSADKPTNESVKIVARRANQLVIATESEQSALLILSEVAYPGWHAKVDGNETKWWRVNYLLRGIALTPGKHRIEFSYFPSSLPIGAGISVVAAAVMIIGLLRLRREDKVIMQRDA